MRKFYKPSGKVSPLSLLYFILTSLLILPILGLIYTYCIWYIPFFYINFLITIGFGFAVGITMMFLVVRLGKVRNRKIAALIGALGALVALYFHWSVWVDLVINAGESYGSSKIGITVSNVKFLQVFSLASNPSLLFELIAKISQTGTWGFKSIPVSGFILSLIWIIEAIVVVFFSLMLARNASGVPICELNNQWFKDKKTPELDFITDKKLLLNSLDTNDLSYFESLSNVKDKEQDSHSVFTVYSSKNNEHYLTVENQTAKSKGKFERDEFITYFGISAPVAKVLLSKSK